MIIGMTRRMMLGRLIRPDDVMRTTRSSVSLDDLIVLLP